ncbi:alpha/beta fold hydrolase [Mycobacterium sp. SMC-4]|uniref:alpha/beta fold hydrolase n=1 Tax=Mycobacterium sp. SMC-4 TaxID=2857059 RepID=UPI0021B4B0F3|nr:alpha/beta fold hydrolase [Mycobacterium sp. SMC-4]UXA18070.1 alpha/beta fold hydrolase [Mycobacterium sp. SMC-4]
MTNPGVAGNRLPTFTNDGLTFDVIDEGPLDGPVIIALHGFPARARSYRPMIQELATAGFRVLAPDQRGYSPRARPAGVRAYATGRLTADVIALADQAGLTKFHVMGHDWGATVAWEVAGSHPDRVATVTALSVPHPRAFLAAMARGQLLRSWYMIAFHIPWIPERFLHLLFTVNRLVARRSARRSGPIPATDIAEFWREPGAATAALNWYRAMFYRSSRTAKIGVPTLYVWSSGDPFLGRRAAELTERYVEGPYRFEILEGVSHWIPHERPRQVADMVISHIADTARWTAPSDRKQGRQCSI